MSEAKAEFPANPFIPEYLRADMEKRGIAYGSPEFKTLLKEWEQLSEQFMSGERERDGEVNEE